VAKKGAEKGAKKKYVHYIGDNYYEHLAGCKIKKLRLTTSKVNNFHPTTQIDFLDLDSSEKGWIIEGCKKIKTRMIMPIETSSHLFLQKKEKAKQKRGKVYANVHYYKMVQSSSGEYNISWLEEKKRSNFIMKSGHSQNFFENCRKLKVFDLPIEAVLLKGFSKVELYHTAFFRHFSIFHNITYLKLYGIAMPYDLPPQLQKLKLANIFHINHLGANTIEKLICDMDKLKFLKVRNCDNMLYLMKLPQNLQVYKIVIHTPDIFLLSTINELKTAARIIIKKLFCSAK
jgi:hypothetical protein